MGGEGQGTEWGAKMVLRTQAEGGKFPSIQTDTEHQISQNLLVESGEQKCVR